MKNQTFSLGILIFVICLTTANQALKYEGNLEDQDDSIMWENLLPIMHPNRDPDINDQDLAQIIERFDPNFNKPQLEFPKLTARQQKFGVNPGYPEFTEPKIRVLAPVKQEEIDESIIEPHLAATEGPEVVKDPLGDEAKDKKASSVFKFTEDDLAVVQAALEQERINDIYFTTIVAVSSALVAFAVVGAGICYHRYQRNAKAAEDVEYPAYGVTGGLRETSPTSADRKLAQNAQLYHYQHQKQQMIAIDSNNGNGHRANGVLSDNDSDEEEGDYTVYECPGLAPAGEMEVRNPMFEDEATPKAESKTKK